MARGSPARSPIFNLHFATCMPKLSAASLPASVGDEFARTKPRKLLQARYPTWPKDIHLENLERG